MSTFTSTILITGGTLGLGYWTAYEIANQFPSAKVIIASRSNHDHAEHSLNAKLKREQVSWLQLDLGSTTAIRNFVEAFPSHPPVSHLILNAGLQFWNGDVQYSSDGVESTFAINHLGGALLFFLLKPRLTPTARIIFTASGVHDPAQETGFDATYQSAELLAHPTDKIPYNEKRQGGHRYASSKLANMLFTYALEKRFQQSRDKRWTVAAFDPGLMPGTGFGRDLGPIIMWIANNILTRMMWLMRLMVKGGNAHLPQDSGKSQAILAGLDGEKAKESSGTYWSGREQIDSSTASHDVEKQDDLWKWTVGFLAKDEEEKRMFETF